LKWVAGYVVRPFSRQAAIMCHAYVSTPEDVRCAQADYDDYAEQFLNKWQKMGLDGLICPALTVPAVEHKMAAKLTCCCISTVLFNIVDFPAGVVPTGVVSDKDNEILMDENQWPVGNNIVLRDVRAASSNAVGMPLSVQIATLPYQEEKCIGIMKQVEAIWAEENKEHGLAS